MHYAEFAEDEVSHFVRLSIPCIINPDALTPHSERGTTRCHQGIRTKQMEGHWTESRQTRQGKWTASESAFRPLQSYLGMNQSYYTILTR